MKATPFLARWSLLLLLLAPMACDDDEEGSGDTGGGDTGGGDTGGGDTGGDTGGGDTGAPTEVSIASFNLGLADNFVPYSDERQEPVAAQLNNIDADVLCLQEVWETEAAEEVIAATADTFPYSFWVETDEEPGPPACTEQEIEPLVTCVEENECETDPDGLAACALAMCDPEIDVLNASNPGCFGCAAANIQSTLEEIVSACTSASFLFAFEGRNGLVLLSRHPLNNTDHTVFSSTTNARALLQAEVELEPFGTVHVLCTHLTAIFDDVPYTGENGSWAEENAMQIGQIADLADTFGDDPVVLIGDMNTGPALPGVDAEFSENFDLFTEAGFANPYLDLAQPPCTYGCDNTFHDDGATGKVIDHIFLRGWPDGLTFEATRIMDATIEITAGEETVTTNMSDHFGIRLNVSTAP